MRFIFVIAIGLASISTVWAPQALRADPTLPAESSLDDSVEALVPIKSRSEEEEDRLDSVAHFSAGRMLEQRQHLTQALRQYERALRYDPNATPVLNELLPLAFGVHPDEGMRYLVKYLDQTKLEIRPLLEAGQDLEQAGDFAGALKVFQQAEKLLAKEKPSPQQVAVQMELGRLYFLAQEYKESAAALKRVQDALEKPQDFGLNAAARKALAGEKGGTYELMGTVFLETKQAEQARQAFEQLNKSNPDSAALELNLARVNLAAGQPQAALDRLQKYFDSKTEVTTIASFEALSQSLKDLHQSDQLNSRLETLHAAQPKNALLTYFLGQQYREAGALDKALPLLEAAHAEKPTVQSYQALWDVYLHAGQNEKLLVLLGQMMDKSGSVLALEAEIKALLKDEKQTTSLIDAAKKLPADSEEQGFELRAAALVAAEAKRWNDVETLFNVAIKAQPKAAADMLTTWGLGLLLDEKNDEAAKVFQRGLALPNLANDEQTKLNYYLASALEMAGKTDGALTAAKKAVEKDPKNLNYAGRPAWVLYHAKRQEEAAKAYQELLDKYETNFENEGARDVVRDSHSALSNLCVLKHDIPHAVEWLEQILDEFPDDAGANNDLGYLWADENQHLHRAHRMIQLAVADEPDNFAYRDSLGWVLHRLGRDSEALVELHKALKVEKPDGEVLDHIGEVYAKLGQTGEAKASWQRSAEAFHKAGEEEKMKDVQKKLEVRSSKLE